MVLLCFHAGIKKYVVGLIIKTSSDATNVEVSGGVQRALQTVEWCLVAVRACGIGGWIYTVVWSHV